MKKDEKRVFTEIEINATREQVWSILTDFDKMPEWSSSFQGMEGEFKAGGKASSYFKAPLGKKDMKFDHTIIEFKEGFSFGWSDPIMLGMKDHHIYKLEELPNGNTRFIQTDSVEGGLTFLMGKLMLNEMNKTYQKFNQELKERVESLYPKN